MSRSTSGVRRLWGSTQAYAERSSVFRCAAGTRLTRGFVLGLLMLSLTAAAVAQDVPAAKSPTMATVDLPAQKPAQATKLDGCLTTAGGLMPKLTIFRSDAFYRLEPREGLMAEKPLAFAQNAGALVEVTGHLAPGGDPYDPDHAPVFVVDTIEKLAPSCDERTSLSEIRRRAHPAPPANASSGAASHVVEMTDELLTFKPPKLQIRAGQTVLWKNSSREVHTVTGDPHSVSKATDAELPPGAKPFDSGYMNPGQSYSHTFLKPGTYRYVCTLHEVQGMIGEVIVKP